jgi:hypothetical protein
MGAAVAGRIQHEGEQQRQQHDANSKTACAGEAEVRVTFKILFDEVDKPNSMHRRS